MTDRLTVFYDGACPLCAQEIAFYRRLDRSGRIAWEDVSAAPGTGPEAEVACGLTRADALARLHVRRADGTLESGAAAFVAIWRDLPVFRWIAPFARVPGVLAVMERAYRGFLKIRPGLVRRVARTRG